MIQLKLNQHAKGRAMWEQNGRLVVARNTLTYKAGDLIVNALTRNGPFQITHLYLRYNGESAVSPLDVSDLKATTRAEFLATSSGNGGFFVPLLAAPAVDSSDESFYAGNRLTFYFRVPHTVNVEDNGLTGTFSVEDSWISAMGLAVSVNNTDRTQDLIFSAIQGGLPEGDGTFDMFQIPTNGQKAVTYPFAIDFA